MLEWNQSGSALPSDGFEDFIAEHNLVSQRFKATLFGSDGIALIVLNSFDGYYFNESSQFLSIILSS